MTHPLAQRTLILMMLVANEKWVSRAGSSGFCRRLLLQSVKDALKDEPAIGAAEQRLAGALRVRHQTRHVPALIADSGDVFDCAVGICRVRQFALCRDVLPEDLLLRLERLTGGRVREVAAFPVRDGDAQEFAGGDLICER